MLASVLPFLAGCGSPPNSQPPASTPSLGSGTALRPQFSYGNDKTQRTGTAFAIRAKSGQKYLITAAHLYRDDEWPTMQTITLPTMEGKVMGHCEVAPLHIGKYTEDSPHSKAWIRNYSEDLMITPLPENTSPKPCPLAPTNPVRGAWVWG